MDFNFSHNSLDVLQSFTCLDSDGLIDKIMSEYTFRSVRFHALMPKTSTWMEGTARDVVGVGRTALIEMSVTLRMGLGPICCGIR